MQKSGVAVNECHPAAAPPPPPPLPAHTVRKMQSLHLI